MKNSQCFVVLVPDRSEEFSKLGATFQEFKRMMKGDYPSFMFF